MQTTFRGSTLFGVSLVGSLLASSCSAPAPAPTTNIKVEVSPATQPNDEAKTDKNSNTQVARSTDAGEDAGESERSSVASSKPARQNREAERTQTKPARVPKGKLLEFYDRLPAKHFAAFGNVSRRSLLARKGATVDYKYNFIEIPGSKNSEDGDLRLLQITLFPNGNEPWCAVSRIVWPDGQTPGALDFYYGNADNGALRATGKNFFPYELGTFSGGYVSAYLPQRGLEIRTSSAVDSEFNGETFRYNRNFRVGEPAFVEVPYQEEG